MKDRLDKLEQKYDALRDKSLRAIIKVGLNPENLAADNGLFARMDRAEADIRKLKDALRGNVTWPGVVAIVMKAGGFVAGLGAIYAILRLFFKH